MIFQISDIGIDNNFTLFDLLPILFFPEKIKTILSFKVDDIAVQ